MSSETPSTAVSYNIEVRSRLLLEHITNKKNDWKLLERATGIPAEKWRQFGRGSTAPSSAMLEALGRNWPQYAFWLMTGVSDELHGHHAPNAALAFPNFHPTTAYQATRVTDHTGSEKTISYFQSASQLAVQLFPFFKQCEKDWRVVTKTDARIEGDLILLATLAKLKENEFVFNCQNQKPAL